MSNRFHAFLWPAVAGMSLLLALAMARADAEPGPERWQYLTVSLNHELLRGGKPDVRDDGERALYDTLEESLNKLGSEGWVLVQGEGDLFIFRRPLPPVARTR